MNNIFDNVEDINDTHTLSVSEYRLFISMSVNAKVLGRGDYDDSVGTLLWMKVNNKMCEKLLTEEQIEIDMQKKLKQLSSRGVWMWLTLAVIIGLVLATII